MAKQRSNRYYNREQRRENCPYRNWDNNDSENVINSDINNEDLNLEDVDWENVYEDDPLLNDDKNKTTQKEEKAKSFMDKLLDWGDKGASIFSKIKGGATYYDSGDKYEIYPEDKTNENADKMMRNWIIGIVLLLIISVTALLLFKKKDKKKG